MKKLNRLLWVAILSLLFFVSCIHKRESNINSSDLQMTSFHLDTFYTIEKPQGGTPTLTVKVNYDLPVEDAKLTNTLNRVLFDSLSTDSTKQTLLNWINLYRSDLGTLNGYVCNEKGEYVISDSSSIENKIDLEVNLNVQSLYSDDKIASFSSESNGMESDAAHGWHDIRYVVVDKLKNKVLTEDDIFSSNYKKQLSNLIESHIIKLQSDVKDMLLVEPSDIQSNGNFYVSKDGITYCYNEYEISAYAAGVIKVTIPFNELSEIISETSPINYLVNP